MFTLIYQLREAGIRHRSAGVEIGASSPFWGVKKHRQRHILRCCVDSACGPGKKRKTAVSLNTTVLYTSLFDLRSSFFGVERAFCLEVALGAHAHVLHIVFQIDGHLLALKDESAVHLAAVADGLAAAGADSLHLLDGVGQLQQAGRAGKALERKICPQAVADHRNVQIHRDHEQLFCLLRSEKLALVAQHAGQRRTVSVGRCSDGRGWRTPRASRKS